MDGWQVERPRAVLGLSELEQGGQLADALVSVHCCVFLSLWLTCMRAVVGVLVGDSSVVGGGVCEELRGLRRVVVG